MASSAFNRFSGVLALFLTFFNPTGVSAQKVFTHADTLRGTVGPERAWWDVLRYDIYVRPDYEGKSIRGYNRITYRVVRKRHPDVMQIDLQEPLGIDSITWNNGRGLSFRREGNAWHVQMPRQSYHSVHALTVYYHGKVHEAVRPPWQGGWTFTRDSLGRPWMTVTCQGLGASIWYPCKDHQSDEPDQGASLTMTVPDTLVAVGNGRLQSMQKNGDGTATYRWAVVNPINNYDIIPYIGKYVHFGETYAGVKGPLTLDYWVLDYNLERARAYLPPAVHSMLKAFEYWLGPYPFYEDGYKLVDVPHTGMEHQSAVAYGNHYAYGYRGRDGSGTGLGMKWDFIIVHESAHEWFGNSITSNDLADMWVHEGFANYAETLYVDYTFGKDAGNAYNKGIRRGIRNDRPIIAHYGVNEEGSGDMYAKGGNLLQLIRHSIGNDSLWRDILHGLSSTFYHQTVNSSQIEAYISRRAGFDYGKVFDQYLRTTRVPSLQYYISEDKKHIFFRWAHCVDGFNLPLFLADHGVSVRLLPTTEWKNQVITPDQAALLTPGEIVGQYYVKADLWPDETGK